MKRGDFHLISSPILGIACLALSLIACSPNHEFAEQPSETPLETSGGGGVTPGPETETEITEVIRKLKPALALNDSSCLSCHIQIEGSLIEPGSTAHRWSLNRVDIDTVITERVSWLSAVTQDIREIKVVKDIKISPPTKNDILALKPAEKRFHSVTEPTAAGMAGLSYKNGVFYNNGSKIVCNGDYVLEGTLFLRGITVETSQSCRLYVSGTVFLDFAQTSSSAGRQGIQYLSSNSLANLQIASGSAVIIGMGKCTIEGRLGKGVGGAGALNPVQSDFERIVSAGIGAPQDLDNCIGDQENSIKSRVHVDRLLLAAPVVHSRSTGNVVGTVIADSAMFSLGGFVFKPSDVLAQVSVLPLLSKLKLIEITE